MIVLFRGSVEFPESYSNQIASIISWNRCSESVLSIHGSYNVFLSRTLNGILKPDQLHCITNWSDFPPILLINDELEISLIVSGSMMHFQRIGILAVTAYPSGYLVKSFVGGLAHAPFIETSFPELAVNFPTFNIEYISVLSRFC